MDSKEITNLIKLVAKSNLSEFRLKEGDFEIMIRTDKYQHKSKGSPEVIATPAVHLREPAYPAARPVEAVGTAPATPAPAANIPTPTSDKVETEQESNDGLLEVRSPIVGTFYRAPSPEKQPYIKVGDEVEKGDVVCIVEAMKLFNEIESEISGKVVKTLVEDGTPVEYDQVLFLLDPS